MNVRDSEAVSALLLRHGYRQASGEQDADVVIVNTCSVRGKAEDKALGKLGLLAAGKRERPGLVLGVMGCMAQRLQDAIFRRVPGVDFAVGTRCLHLLPAVLDRVRAGRGPVLESGGEGADGEEGLSGHLPGTLRAFVNVLYGCDRHCAYCVVPAVRGPEWSRAGDRVVEEVSELVANGIREVTLLGQSVMSYGRTNPVWAPGHVSAAGFREPFARLLEAVASVEGLARLRFTSSHPSGCTPELARAMAELPCVCGHLHLPLQSGSDRVLKIMGRGYDADGYRRAVDLLRAAVPGIAISTDVIVGFPSETVGEFDATRLLMDEIGFDSAFVFKYSPRPGTRAAELQDDVACEEKQRRNRVLLEDQDRRSLARHEAFVGSETEVLAEGTSLRNPSRWTGRDTGNRIVVFEPCDGLQPGTLVRVLIERAMPQTLYGKIV